MKILVHGQAYWTKGAYGIQIRHLLNMLAELGVDVAQSCTFGFQGRKMQADGLTLYPMLNDLQGNDIIRMHAQDYQADYVLSLGDVFLLDPQAWGKSFKWLAWTTVDSRPLWPLIGRALTSAYKVIAYSRYGQSVLNESGFNATYIPLCYDPQAFYPDDKRAARELLGIPQDRYVVLMVQANRQQDNRKNFFEQLVAFREFQSAHPDAYLYLHTCMTAGRGGYDLFHLLNEMGMVEGQDYGFADQYKEVVIGASDDEMRATYNACDVLLQCTKAEGFGVPALEAQVCGKPVIYTDYAALPEIVKYGCSVEGEMEWQPVGSWYAHPRKEAIVDGLGRAYRGEYDRETGGVEEYSLPNVAEQYWRPFVRQLRDELEAQPQKVTAA